MYANYHTHSVLCGHASGDMEDYVKAGIRNGLKILGFSDHVPMPFSNGHRSTFRMGVDKTEIYVNRILELKEKYKDDIQILIGYEAEYYPAEFENMLKNILQYPVDYLIQGQHFSGNEYDGISNMRLNTREDLKKLVDTYITSMDTGVFSYIAHPDLLPYEGEGYDEEIRRMLRHAVKTDTPVEYNMLGMEEGRFYPHRRFFELVKEEGAKVVLGCDAHQVDRVANPLFVERAEKELAEIGLVPEPFITLKKVHL